jgi:glyoxylase-like metal-dependent hydrolase (beta-lactamase superfamily II)
MGAAAGLSLPRYAFGQHSAPPATPITTTRLADRFLLIQGAGSNVLAVDGPDGVLLVDGGVAERSADLLKTVFEQTKQNRVGVLFNTHWHWDHTGSNETLGKAGAKIIAHENTKLWLGAEFFVAWQNRTYEPRPKIALPNQTFYTSGKMTFAGQQIEYGYMLQAHTDGDIYVFFPQANILVAGDVASVGSYPVLDYSTGGWIGGLVNAQKMLLGLINSETRIVPGTGPVQTRADLQAEYEMCNAMRERLIKMMREGMGPKDMIAAEATKEFDAKWGNPDLFIKNAYQGLWGHVRELGGIV